MGLAKNCQFLPFFIVGLISQENVFQDILERKNFYLGYKNEKFKKSKMGVFPKGLLLGLVFLSFYLRQNRPEKCVSRYSRKEKRLLQTIKTRSLKSRKFVFFAKGLVHDFWSKIGNFSIFLFQAKQARKMCFTIFQNEKTFFQTIKTTS